MKNTKIKDSDAIRISIRDKYIRIEIINTYNIPPAIGYFDTPESITEFTKKEAKFLIRGLQKALKKLEK